RARHLQVSHDQVAPGLGSDFQRFQTVGGQTHAVSGFFQHPANKLAYADRVVGQDHDLLFGNEIDSVLRNSTAGRRLRARREDAGSVGAGHQRAMLDGFTNHEPVHIDQQDQASVRSDGGAGEQLHVTHIFAQALDYDFVFANDIFHNHSNLPAGYVD